MLMLGALHRSCRYGVWMEVAANALGFIVRLIEIGQFKRSLKIS